MTDLLDDVMRSFHKFRQEKGDENSITIVRNDQEELAPAFASMREHYTNKLLAMTRRGYRHFAGSSLPSESDDLLAQTAQVMGPGLVAILMQAFCDGVMISHKEDVQVKISWRFGLVEALFSDASFRENSNNMAKGFAEDAAVLEFFEEFVKGTAVHLAHITGFVHSEVKPDKVWDIWMLTGASVSTTAYLAGNQLGTTWKERDVLDGIEIATEDHHGSDGEDEGDRGGAEADEG